MKNKIPTNEDYLPKLFPKKIKYIRCNDKLCPAPVFTIPIHILVTPLVTLFLLTYTI